MFENVAVEDLLGTLAVHNFDASDDLSGAEDIDGIRAYELVIRAAQAGQTRLIGVLDIKRAEKMTLGRGDHSLSVIGEVAMARNISPSAAGNHWGIEVGGFAVGLRRLPRVAKAFASGNISEPTARAVVREATGLDREQAAKFDRRVAIRLRGMTVRKAADLARSAALRTVIPRRRIATRRSNFAACSRSSPVASRTTARAVGSLMFPEANALATRGSRRNPTAKPPTSIPQ